MTEKLASGEMDSDFSEFPIDSHSGLKNPVDKPKRKPKKRKRNRQNLFYRTKAQNRRKPKVHDNEACTSPSRFNSDTETDNRNVLSSPKTKSTDVDQSPEVASSLQLPDQNGSVEENGTMHTSTPVKIMHANEACTSPSRFNLDTETDNRNVLSSPKTKSTDVDQSPEVASSLQLPDQNGSVEENDTMHTSTPVKITVGGQSDLIHIEPDKTEADDSSMIEIKASSRTIHTSTPFKVIEGRHLDLLNFASTPSHVTDPSLSVDGISRQLIIKNFDATLSVTVENDTAEPTHLTIPTEDNIYSKIDEVRVPLIVDWSNSNLSSDRTPSLLPNVASPLHGPEVMPQFSGVSVHLIDTLLKHLKCFLPVAWHPISDQEGITVLLHSTSKHNKHKAVQQNVFVDYEQGCVQIGIHGKSLPEDHNIWNETGQKFPLCNGNVVAFANRVVKIVNAVRQLKICTGIEITENNSKMLCDKKDVNFEDNVFGDMNVSCYRSNQCSLLISLKRKKCVHCWKVATSIYYREKRAGTKGSTSNENSEGLRKTPRRNTRHDYLTDSASKRLLKKKQRKIKLQHQTISRLRARITTLLETEGTDIDAQLSKDLKMVLEENKLTEVQKIFLEQQIRCSKVKSKTGMRWHPLMIRFALHLKSISPIALDIVRQSGLIKLPCTQTLFDYSSVYKPESGCNKKIIENVANQVSGLQESYQRFHCLMFDEVTTSQNLVYSKETGELWGYAYLSEVSKEMDEVQRLLEGEQELIRPPPVANHMLTYMIKGTASGVKEAVASYPTTNLRKEHLYERTWEVIGNLEMVGVAVVGLISDGNLVNRAFYQMHVPVTKNDNGIVFDTINFCSGEGRTLYFFNDVPHLLKCIRNNFMSSGKGPNKARCLIKNGQIITWDTIVRLFMDEKDETWTYGFKLNQQNVFPDSYSRMRVPLAAQVMSDTVCKMIVQMGYKGCEETVIFIKKVNDFFDMLNGAHSDQEKKTRNKNLAKYDNHFDPRFTYLMDFLKYLKEWKEDARAATAHLKKNVEACAARQLSWQTLEGIERTVLAFIGCTRQLLANGQKFVMARVFCQDPLEQYFSRQRSMNGGNRNPNPLAFLRNMNTVHLAGQTGFKRTRGNTENLSTEQMSLISTPLEKKPRHDTKRCLQEKYPFMFETG